MCDDSTWISVGVPILTAALGFIGAHFVAVSQSERDRLLRINDALLEAYVLWMAEIPDDLLTYLHKTKDRPSAQRALMEGRIRILETDKRALALMKAVTEAYPGPDPESFDFEQSKRRGSDPAVDHALQALAVHIQARVHRPVESLWTRLATNS